MNSVLSPDRLMTRDESKAFVVAAQQWPLPCETGVWGLQISDMRAGSPVATGTWYHLMSFDITRRHDRSVPNFSRRPLSDPSATLLSLDSSGSRVRKRTLDSPPASFSQTHLLELSSRLTEALRSPPENAGVVPPGE
jgi:hypothetical protein